MTEPRPPDAAPAAQPIAAGAARPNISDVLARPEPDAAPAPLRRPAPCFVTLHDGARLLGCIGTLDASRPLVAAVADRAQRAAFADPNWATPVTLFTGFAFAGMIYFLVSFGMSRYALSMERRLNVQQSR